MPASADLLEHLEMPQCECLNASKEHTLRHCLEESSREDPALYLQSDCDEELLIHLRFMSKCRISSLRIAGPSDTAPSAIRLFVDPDQGLDFDAAKSHKATQEIELTAEQVGEDSKPIELRYVLFQNVSALSIFIPGNLGGGEETVLSKLVLLGEPIHHEGLKRSEDQQRAATKGDWLGS